MSAESRTRYGIGDIEGLLPADVRIVGDPEGKSFTHVAPITEAGPDALVWINPARADKYELLERTGAVVVVCDPTMVDAEQGRNGKCLIIVANPKVVFSGIVAALFVEPVAFEIHPSAVVHPEARLADRVAIGPQTYVGRSTIGDGTVLYGNVFVYDGVTIGRNVTIHAGSVLGADGFGFERDENGEVVKFPQIGGVVIEDDVDIQALVTVDRGSLADTIVRRGAKIDDHVHVAHGVEIGEATFVAASTMFAGSVKIGRNVWVGPGSVFRDYVTVGDGAFIGVGSLVVKDVPAGVTVMGSPARPTKEYKAALAAVRALTEPS